jgi:hypothetical protein
MSFLRSVGAMISRVQRRLRWASPPALLTGYLFFAVIMIVATAVTDLAIIRVGQGGITKGFWFELNWGLNHLIVIPLALFCSARVLRSVASQPAKLAEANMAVNKDFEPKTPDSLWNDWWQHDIGPWWFAIIALLAFGMSYWEWVNGSLLPILRFPANSPPSVQRDLGWTTGHLLAPDKVHKLPNLVLSFAAFTAQGFVVMVFGYVFGTVLAFSIWIWGYAEEPEGSPQPSPGSTEEPWKGLVPNLDSKEDTRRGFEQFEPLVLNVLWTGLAFAFVLFFIRIQSVYDYDTSPRNTSTVFDFIIEDVVKGFFTNIADIFKGELTIFTVGNATNFGNMIVSAAMCVIIAIVIIFPTLILSIAARQSRESLRRCLRQTNCPPCVSHSMKNEEAEQLIGNMDFWPVRYPQPMELLTFVVFAGFCFLFYKFTFLLCGILIIRLVQQVYKGLTTPPAQQPAERVPPQPTAPQAAPPPTADLPSGAK